MNRPEGESVHERARRLIDVERVEGLALEDRRWLEDHLAACEACAARAVTTAAALSALRSISVALPPGLASTTKFRVRLRAAELRRERARNAGLVVGCALSWLAGVASAPLVWKACAWLGGVLDLPRAVWVLGFAAWWFVPISAAALIILWARARSERETLGFLPTRESRSERR
jgi:hypothetical protein